MRDLLNEAANEMVKVKIDGEENLVPKRVAISLRLMNDMLTGTSAQGLRVFQAVFAMGGFNPSHERNMPSDEARRRFLEQLAEEARAEENSKRRHPGDDGDEGDEPVPA